MGRIAGATRAVLPDLALYSLGIGLVTGGAWLIVTLGLLGATVGALLPAGGGR